MDINTWRGIATIVVMVAFLGICIWAYSSKRKTNFQEAANLPFADENNSDKQGD
jgi:cytochrome c oxidase cbb3-type subunit 4